MSSERGVPLAAAAAADAEDLHGRAARRQRPGPGGEPGHPARAALGHPVGRGPLPRRRRLRATDSLEPP